MVLGEVGPREPDVGNQLVGGRRRDEEVVAFDLLEVIDVGRPAHTPGQALVGVEGGRGLKRVLGELELDFRRLHARVDQRIQHEEMGRGILREHDRLPAQIRHRLDGVADDDAVAAVRPVDLLEDPGHDPRVFPQSLQEQASAVPKSMPRIEWSHELNWVKAAKGLAPASSPFEYAALLTETMLLGIVALRTGQARSGLVGAKLLYDGPNMAVTNLPEANQYLTREYRKGWEV